MNKDIAIEIKNLSKMYKIYKEPKYLLKEILFRKKYHDEFWALKNINLKIKKGNVVGIIGRNGAGKSTLLKILAGTLDKTSGTIKIDGKITAILELGTGFHPEYTGRENIYNGGVMLGMNKKEIDQKINSIIEFSELGEFIDRPFKTYSTGMQVRLSFSLATSVDPEVLIIDEALAAGDIYFMGKCIDKIKDICKNKNITVLFVSHSTYLIQRLCDQAIWLEKGSVEEIGPSLDVVKLYEIFMRNLENKRLKRENNERLQKIKQKNNPKQIMESKETEKIDYVKLKESLQPQLKGITISKVKIFNNQGKATQLIRLGEKMTVRIFFEALKKFDNLSFCFEIYRNDGVIILSSNSNLAFDNKFQAKSFKIGPIKPGKGCVDIIIDRFYLGPHEYIISVGIFPINEYKRFYDWHDRIYKFRSYKEGYPLLNTVEFALKYKLNQGEKDE